MPAPKSAAALPPDRGLLVPWAQDLNPATGEIGRVSRGNGHAPRASNGCYQAIEALQPPAGTFASDDELPIYFCRLSVEIEYSIGEAARYEIIETSLEISSAVAGLEPG